MARKQDEKKKSGKTSGKGKGEPKSLKKAIGKAVDKGASSGIGLSLGKAVAKASAAKDVALTPAARRKPGRPSKKDSAMTGITLSAKTSAKSSGKKSDKPAGKTTRKAAQGGKSTSTTAKAGKALTSAKDSALGFFADLKPPHIPTSSLPHIDIAQTARDIGGQIMSVLNTSAGRIVAAEVLVYLATALTKTAAKTEAGQDAADTVMNAGAKIAAAAASAGAKIMETGAQAGAGLENAGVKTGAKDMAREVASAAVGAVGAAVADVTEKVARRRGRPPGAKASSDGQTSSDAKPSSNVKGPSGRPGIATKLLTETANLAATTLADTPVGGLAASMKKSLATRETRAAAAPPAGSPQVKIKGSAAKPPIPPIPSVAAPLIGSHDTAGSSPGPLEADKSA